MSWAGSAKASGKPSHHSPLRDSSRTHLSFQQPIGGSRTLRDRAPAVMSTEAQSLARPTWAVLRCRWCLSVGSDHVLWTWEHVAQSMLTRRQGVEKLESAYATSFWGCCLLIGLCNRALRYSRWPMRVCRSRYSCAHESCNGFTQLSGWQKLLMKRLTG